MQILSKMSYASKMRWLDGMIPDGLLNEINPSIAYKSAHVSARVLAFLSRNKNMLAGISRRNLFPRGICHFGDSTRLIYRESPASRGDKPRWSALDGVLWIAGVNVHEYEKSGSRLSRRASGDREKKGLDKRPRSWWIGQFGAPPNKRIRHISSRMKL